MSPVRLSKTKKKNIQISKQVFGSEAIYVIFVFQMWCFSVRESTKMPIRPFEMPKKRCGAPDFILWLSVLPGLIMNVGLNERAWVEVTATICFAWYRTVKWALLAFERQKELPWCRCWSELQVFRVFILHGVAVEVPERAWLGQNLQPSWVKNRVWNSALN